MKYDPGGSPLLTDLYQLTMLQTYYEQGMEDEAVFEFFVRRLPDNRNFMLYAGLESVLDFLEDLRFSSEELAWLKSEGRFNDAFIDRLASWRFTGDVHGLPEGTVFFPDEPALRVTAPLPEAQLVESRLINLLHYQTLIATKAARCVLAAPGKLLVDFGMRRAHGAEASLQAARASYIAGFTGTATVLAGREYSIPLFGTMAHSFIQAHESEPAAFADFARSHPDNVVLLIDTYDTENGAKIVTELAKTLRAEEIPVKAVRLDSGDISALAHSVRAILDAGGCEDVTIFASGNLDEYRLSELIATGCPIDGFGVGTRLDISEDAPSLDCVYKLQEYAGRARRKRSTGKATLPGRKQIFRRRDAAGLFAGDTLTLDDRTDESGEPLVVKYMDKGRRVGPAESLDDIRDRATDQLAALPETLRSLETRQTPYPVDVSDALKRLTARVDSETR